MFIKREIPQMLSGEPYFDLVTPYGYGGPLILQVEDEKKDELIEAFICAFGLYCLENRVVSEFVRFHPIFGNAEDFSSCYKVSFCRYTIKTNLSSPDPIQAEYSSSCRRDIKHALKAGVTYRVVQNPPDLEKFKELYYLTMQRNHADSYYYFDNTYFADCLKLFRENVVLVEVLYEGKVIGASLNFAYGKIIHAHLTGTLMEYHRLFPAYVLQYGLAMWGKENGFELVHHGGGRTNQLDDKLYLFKKKFGKQEEGKFYVGQRIWNKKVYSELCRAAGAEKEEEFFPAYRIKVSAETKIQ
jgi:serine/alanine adding enzyme